jgi:hypothetical protein
MRIDYEEAVKQLASLKLENQKLVSYSYNYTH